MIPTITWRLLFRLAVTGLIMWVVVMAFLYTPIEFAILVTLVMLFFTSLIIIEMRTP